MESGGGRGGGGTNGGGGGIAGVEEGTMQKEQGEGGGVCV